MGRRTGIILAWDKSDYDYVRDLRLLEELEPHIDMVKVGLESMTAFVRVEGRGGASLVSSVAQWISEIAADQLELGVMWDAKLKDISNTVINTAKNIFERQTGIKMLTVDADMSDEALIGVAQICRENSVMSLAVTVLTDITPEQCQLRYGTNPLGAVNNLAKNADECWIQGLVCSGEELKSLELPDMKKVVPGIRPAWAAVNDQKRVMTPAEAAKAGADYVVIGRPILKPPAGMTPVEAAKRIREELDEALATT